MKKRLTYLLLISIALGLSPAYGQSKSRPQQQRQQQDTTIYYSIRQTDAANSGTRATFSFSASIGQSDAEQTCGSLNRDAKAMTKGICRVQGVTIAGIPNSYTVSVITGGENDPKSVHDLVIKVIQRFNPKKTFVQQQR